MFARDPTGEGVQDDDQVAVVFGAVGVFFLFLRTRERQGDVTSVGAGYQVRVHRAVVAVALRDAGVPGAGTAIAPQGGAVAGIEGRDALLGENHRPRGPRGHLEQTGDVPAPGDSGADAGRPGRWVAVGGQDRGVGDRDRGRHEMERRDQQRQDDDGRQSQYDPAGSSLVSRGPGPGRVGVLLAGGERADAGRVVEITGNGIQAVTYAPQRQVGGGHRAQAERRHGLGQQHPHAERGPRERRPPQVHQETGHDSAPRRHQAGRDGSVSLPGSGGEEPDGGDGPQQDETPDERVLRHPEIPLQRKPQHDGDQQDEQPRRPCSPEQRYESEGGLRDGLPRRGAGIVVVKEKVETDA